MPRLPAQISGRGLCAALAFVFLSGLSSGPALAAESVRQVADAEYQKQWENSMALIRTGKFAEAEDVLDKLLSSGDRQVPLADASLSQVDQWLEEYLESQRERRKLAREDYEKYVSWVKEDIEGYKAEQKRGWWRHAVLDSARAYNSALDREAMLEEPWFKEVLDGALTAAKEYEQEQEWLKAARIYGPLTEIFPFNKDYRESLKRCQEHIRLELFYSEDSDWEATVKDIYPSMASDAFRKIEDSYLEEPVFTEAAKAGLEQMLRLVETPKLAEVFPDLKEEDRVQEFIDRLQVRLRQVKNDDQIDAEDLIELFERVLAINREIQLIPNPVLIHEFVHGALQPLDRFSDMLWPADIMEFNKHTQGRFSGVGIQIRKDPGEPIRVMSPLEGSPAYRAGIQPGDLITKVNGESTNKITVTQAVRKITGPPGTTVTLAVRRSGEEKEFSVTLKRQEITVFTIKGHHRNEDGSWEYLLDPERKIAYIRMTNFTEGTIDELGEVLEQLTQDGMQGLIFDLRGNPGGPLKSAVEVTDLFLGGEKKIVSTKDRWGQPWAKASTNDQHYDDFPMIVLVDETTASASEIVSGALQVHGRAMVLGERSYGKGSVQQVLPLNRSNMAFLKLTTAHYYLPNDRCLHREEDSRTWGVDPDVVVKLVPKEFFKMRQLQTKMDILKGLNQDALSEDELEAVTSYERPDLEEESVDEENAAEAEDDSDEELDADEPDIERNDENEFPARDPQVEAALMMMRIRLVSDFPLTEPTEGVAITSSGK